MTDPYRKGEEMSEAKLDIRERAEKLAHDISNPFDGGKPVVEYAIYEISLAALREFGEELADICKAQAEASLNPQDFTSCNTCHELIRAAIRESL